MELSNLIGKPLEEACLLLREQNLAYVIEKTAGYKDTELLKEEYVLRAIAKNDTITLTTGLFKTTI